MNAPTYDIPIRQSATAGLSSSAGRDHAHEPLAAKTDTNPKRKRGTRPAASLALRVSVTLSTTVRPARPPREGFTLLEILIATALMTTLLWTLWALMDIYTDLFADGEARTEQSQLVRSLSQLLTDDLRSAIQDPAVPVSKTSRTQTAARRFGMYGTSDYLRIDILQVPPFPIAPTPTGDEMQSTSMTGSGLMAEDEVRIAQAPELRTVYYEFTAPRMLEAEEGLVEVETGLEPSEPDARPGLTRRELDFETPDEEMETDSNIQSAIPDDFQIETFDGSMMEEEESFDEILENEPDDSVMWAPEVVGLRFRYFDGRGWRSSWDSLARKGLPIAVEVNMQISSFDDAETIHRRAAPEEAGLLETVELEGDLPEAMEEPGADQPPPPREHRVVIFLPTSPLKKAPKAKRRESTFAAVTLPAPSPPPRPVVRVPAPRTRAKSATKPGGWMRINTRDR